MGVVYLAEDTKLDRSVALKFLPAHLLGNEDIRARFEREAKAAASLHHPNICPVYEIDEADGKSFISMAFIEGETLHQKIARGPMALEQALAIAQQIAEGLDAAHAKGVVHRDIKPENVIVDSKGRATIMDFGLAQLTEASRLTRTGETLGTVIYMSPEQTDGSGADQRSDIWSLGVVLYEMVTGQQPFKGDYDKAVMYSILNEPHEPITAIRAGLPMELEVLIGKCLEKDADQRYSDVGELSKDLGSLAEKVKLGGSRLVSAGASQAVPASTQIQAPPPSSQSWRLPWALAALFVVAAAGLAFLYTTQPSYVAPLRRFALQPAGTIETNRLRSGVAVSPDGRRIAYTTTGVEGKLWVQDLEQSSPYSLDGTEGAFLPFWSLDSELIAYATSAELKKVSLSGGRPISVCRLPSLIFSGGTWSPDGESIVFSSGNYSLFTVPARGGAAESLVTHEQFESLIGEPTVALARPHFLPPAAGKRVLAYTFGDNLRRTVAVHDLESGRVEILTPGSHPSYSPTGHLIYQEDLDSHRLWALPIALDTLQATDEAFPVAENGHGPTVAADGSLVYLDTVGSLEGQLVWLDRQGNKTGVIGDAQASMSDPALSPDGRFVAVSAVEGGSQDIWIWDVRRGVKQRLFTEVATDGRPFWSPTGEEIVFDHTGAGGVDISVQSSDGDGAPRVLVTTPYPDFAMDWSRDGEYILYLTVTPETLADLMYLKRQPDGVNWEPHELLRTQFNEAWHKLSPDGRYFVYVSEESGRPEIYVRSFPDAGGQRTVSSNGGAHPRWGADGSEIFYIEGGALMAVSVTTEPVLSVGSPTRLFEHRSLDAADVRSRYDVSADGQRFVLVEPVGAEEFGEPSIRIVQNWYEEFRDRQ